MSYINKILVFDIDGVITDPAAKTITHPQIISYISQQLFNHIPVCFNTGRSSDWVQQQIIPYFTQDILFSHLFISCEMGNVVSQLSQDSNLTFKVINPKLLPPELTDDIFNIIQNSYQESMFIDTTKQTIITIEMKNNFDHSKYLQHQSKLSATIHTLLNTKYPQYHLHAGVSNIAIDIKPISINKSTGASHIWDWLNANYKTLLPTLPIVSLGDSSSDLEMANFFAKHSPNTEFVYVGTTPLPSNNNIKILTTHNAYSAGTLEYLNTQIKNTNDLVI